MSKSAWAFTTAGFGLLVLMGCGHRDPASTTTTVPTPSSSVRPAANVQLRIDFEDIRGDLDEGSLVADRSGEQHSGTVHLSGELPTPLRVVEGAEPGGTAVGFPVPCPVEKGSACPKAIVEVQDSAAFNPGHDDFSYGAVLRLEPDRTSQGSNVIQKGFSLGGGGQWKLQVDGLAGNPSCVLVDTGGATTVKVTAARSVADGRWHDVNCHRTQGALLVEVDKVIDGRSPLTGSMEVSPAGPVRLGGKGLKPNNDQFFGEIDEIFYAD